MILREGIEMYHASYKVLDKIDLSCCSEGKDFGKGFYLTTDFEQAIVNEIWITIESFTNYSLILRL